MNDSGTRSAHSLFDDIMSGLEEVRAYSRGETDMRITTVSTEPQETAERAPLQFVVLFERGPSQWGATVPDLPGCVATGETVEEAESRIRAAMRDYVGEVRRTGKTLPERATRAKLLTMAD